MSAENPMELRKRLYQATRLRLPERRRYCGADLVLDRLPFVDRKPAHGAPASHWSLPHTDDYGEACAVGRECAAHFAQYLKDNPGMAGSNRLGDIAKDIDFRSEAAVKGYWVGFFAQLEHWILAGVRERDVFEDTNAQHLEGVRIEANRQLEALSSDD